MKKKISILLMMIGVLLLGCGIFFTFTGGNSSETINTVSLKDDFFESVNYDKLSTVSIPTDANAWSTFYDAQVMVNTKKKIVEEKLLSNPKYTNHNMDVMVTLFEDYEARNKLGISELQKYLDMVDNAATIEEFNKVYLIIAEDLNEGSFVNIDAETDINNNNRKVPIIQPAKVEDIFEVYTEPKYEKYKEAYIQFRTKILKQYGYSDERIKEVNDMINSFVTRIQSKSKVLSNINDISKLYNYYTMDDIKSNIHNLPIVEYLELLKIDNLDSYVFYDFEHYIELDANYTIENLEVLKEIEKIRILESIAVNYTTEEYLQIGTDLQNDIMGINYDLDDMKLYILNNLKESLIGDDLYREYEKAYFTEKDKESVRELIDEIRDYYKELINDSKWLDDSTKKEGIKKIDSLKVNIGYIEKKKTDEFELVSKENGGTLISNYILDVKNSTANYYKEFEDGNVQTSYDDLSVNAYYMPTENSINFPAAFYELAANTDDYYEKLAIFGSVIGHEISHAFDLNGSQFDENGNYRNWWTENDKAKYDELKQKIIDYYNGYDLYDIKIDGDKTLGENTADLAGMKAILAVAEKHNATKEDYKKIFESYAKLWATKIEKDNVEKQVVTDSHSPNKIRVNAVLSSMDKFYEVYDIKEGDKMYVSPENRVGLW